jgi:23S rRNA pseudouridine1911/1915/1917 synthase
LNPYFILMPPSPIPSVENFSSTQLTLTPNHLGLRFDVVLAQLMPQFSRSRIQQWCEGGFVTQLDIAVIANHKVKKISPITVHPQAEDSLKAFKAEDLNLNIVYEDKHLAVIYKPVGMVVHPGAGNWTGTLMNGLLHRYPASSSLPRAGIVHRLDRDTSGLMVVAKDSQSYNALVDALKARTVQRRYVAITHGVPAWLTMRVDAPIGRDPKLRTRMVIVPGTVARPSTGKSAITDTRVLASNMAAGVGLVECKLHTGRTHQIRVHLSHIRHALVGDATYGGKPLLGMTRQALHAWSLSFAHPITGKTIANHCAPPDDMLGALSSIGVQWPALEKALLASPAFEVALEEPVEHVEDIFEFGDDFDDEDDDFDESGVEVIYVRD